MSARRYRLSFALCRRHFGVAVVALTVVLATAMSACSSGDDGGPSTAGTTAAAEAPVGAARLVGVAEASALLDDPEVVVVDVRTPEEFAGGHLPGARNIDLEGPGFADAVAALDAGPTYLVYCRTGRRSAIAAGAFTDRGLDTVDMDGGIVAWEGAGYPVEA